MGLSALGILTLTAAVPIPPLTLRLFLLALLTWLTWLTRLILFFRLIPRVPTA